MTNANLFLLLYNRNKKYFLKKLNFFWILKNSAYLCNRIQPKDGEKQNNNKTSNTMKSRKETATAFVMGKKATASNFTTDGQEATSFDTVIAAHVGRAILIKDVYTFVYCGERLTGRTPTTERQKAAIIWAAHVAKVPAFVVPNIGIWGEHTHRANLKFLRAEAKKCREKAKRARLEEMRTYWAEWAEEKTKTANRYYKLFLTA